jgi:sugar O-acyltransferase (sialic acid O-acetyltransferase NeuD family)
MKQDLLIFPFGGNGLEALSCLGDEYEFLGFIDDNAEKQGGNKLGFPVYSREALKKYPDAKVLAVPGNPGNYKERDKVIAGLHIPEKRFARVIHPSASIAPLASLGYNCLIMAGVVLTSNCKIGNHVCILPNSVIHHDSEIGDFTLIGSNVSVAGNVTVGKMCYIGTGTSVLNGLSLGNRSLTGLGSVIIRPVPENATVAGNPARILT